MEGNLTFEKSKHMVEEFYQKTCRCLELNYHHRICEWFSQSVWTLKATCVVRKSGGGHLGGGDAVRTVQTKRQCSA